MPVADLEVLVGTWDLTGRSAGADKDDVSGEMTAVSLLGGRMLQLTGTILAGGARVQSVELIWQGPEGTGFRAHVYDGSGEPLDYRWDIDGDTLTHAGLGMTYTGTISADRSTIGGSWLADPDRPDMTPANYSAVMRRRPLLGGA
jgi:hypothetical protein